MAQVRKSGSKPQGLVNETSDKLFLHFANDFGLTSDIPVHRKSIFNYIQTHKCARTEQNLQSTLNTSNYFNSVGNGYYCLNEIGVQTIKKEFVENKVMLNLPLRVRYSAFIHNHFVELVSDPELKKYIISVDKNPITKVDFKLFNMLNIEFPNSGVSESKPRKIFDAILNSEYEWAILG